ncbi:hypothetical protein Brms1b_011620 [Colletotrichum noveboracense]|nr:hypothetical protein Brms1b_011620 [Colletotrichum noveboracense]
MDRQSQATLCTLRSATHANTIATVDNIEAMLANDEKVRVAGVDADGILRGKIMDKEKFLSTSKKYFHEIFDFSKKANCGLEGWHTESGPGVYEANIFARSGPPDQTAAWPDIAQLSDVGRYFLAGILVALPDIMPLLAPSINSYKRLVENYWAPVVVSWGLEDRLASVRRIAPPVCKPAATRFEVRIPGADLHPHYALTAIVAAGWRGVMKKLDIPIPPAKIQRKDTKPELLPDSLLEATHRFKSPDSLAREILGDDFVDFFAATREHELRVWREAVTDW